MNNKILVGNIQEFSLEDGEGIRTTVFLKGCNVCCPWCANPENMVAEIETYSLLISSPVRQYYSETDLFQLIMKDRIFWRDKGGVTFSGGEPFLQLGNCTGLLRRLKKSGVNIAVETSLYIKNEYIVKAIPWIDYLYIDFKILNAKSCRAILGGNYVWFLNNLRYISQYKIHYTARLPVIKEVTDSLENIKKMIELLVEYRPLNVEIFSVHNMAAEKYEKLGKKYHYFEPVGIEELNVIKEQIQMETGLPVSVLTI